ncbi:MAG: hypothetical protein HZA89_13275 [Verrucomicrobia bacterium]|nr:hypothetical protein [Verrucomicrobiota bacterium]
MKTHSVTAARASLGQLCKDAIAGREHAILCDGVPVKLQPLNGVAELSDAESFPKQDRELSRRATGKFKPFTEADRRRIAAAIPK